MDPLTAYVNAVHQYHAVATELDGVNKEIEAAETRRNDIGARYRDAEETLRRAASTWRQSVVTPVP